MKYIVVVLSLLFVTSAFSQTKQLIKLSDGVERYVEFTPPKGNLPWIVFTNGLVFEMKRSQVMDAELIKKGYGVVHYYYRGQDLTLRREVEMYKTPSFMRTGLSSQDFVQELKEIIQALKIRKKVVLASLSYGSHVAANFAQTYPQAVQKLVFMAPLVVPLEKYQPQNIWLDWNLAAVRMLWGHYFYEYAYKQIYSTYLNGRVSDDKVPESLAHMPNEYRTSLFHLVRAARDFDLKKFQFTELGENSVHYMLAQEEIPAALVDQSMSFDQVNKAAKGSLIWFRGYQHAIPESAPVLGAQVLDEIIKQSPHFQPGQKYKITSQGLSPL